MVESRDSKPVPAEEPDQAPELAVVFCHLPQDLSVSDAELAAITRLLGEDLPLFLGGTGEPRRRT